MSISSFARVAALVAGLAIPLVVGLPTSADDHNPCNPCAAKKANPCESKHGNPCNPCAPKESNPCGAKNPCNPCGAKGMNPCNPCASKDANPCNPCAPRESNPCGVKNPCNPCGAKGMNPCNPCNPCGASGRVDPAKFTRPAGLRMAGGDQAQLVEEGEKLWNDKSLSTNGAACATCHVNYAAFLPTFARSYPHEVTMVKNRSGVDEVDAAEMVQFCMLQPMQAEPLPWSSRELAALAAYVEHIQPGFEPGPAAMNATNPCNPCAAKANPCGANNPCSR